MRMCSYLGAASQPLTSRRSRQHLLSKLAHEVGTPEVDRHDVTDVLAHGHSALRRGFFECEKYRVRKASGDEVAVSLMRLGHVGNPCMAIC